MARQVKCYNEGLKALYGKRSYKVEPGAKQRIRELLVEYHKSPYAKDELHDMLLRMGFVAE